MSRGPMVNAAQIAVVGIGCRLPSEIDTPEALWDSLKCGEDAIGPIPNNRLSLGFDLHYDLHTSGTKRSYPRVGGFLKDVAGFDAQFFRISPREAMSIDPQQRLILETVWEALEHANIPAD